MLYPSNTLLLLSECDRCFKKVDSEQFEIQFENCELAPAVPQNTESNEELSSFDSKMVSIIKTIPMS